MSASLSSLDGRRGHAAPPAEKCASMVLEALARTVETVLQARVAPHELPRAAARAKFNLEVDVCPDVRALLEPLWRAEGVHRPVRVAVVWHPGPGGGGGGGGPGGGASDADAAPPGDGAGGVLLERWDVHYLSLIHI